MELRLTENGRGTDAVSKSALLQWCEKCQAVCSVQRAAVGAAQRMAVRVHGAWAHGASEHQGRGTGRCRCLRFLPTGAAAPTAAATRIVASYSRSCARYALLAFPARRGARTIAAVLVRETGCMHRHPECIRRADGRAGREAQGQDDHLVTITPVEVAVEKAGAGGWMRGPEEPEPGADPRPTTTTANHDVTATVLPLPLLGLFAQWHTLGSAN